MRCRPSSWPSAAAHGLRAGKFPIGDRQSYGYVLGTVTTFLLTAGLFLLVVTLMAVGVMFGGRRLQGSCGGVGGGACSCSEARQARCERRPPAANAPIPSERLSRQQS